MRYPLHDGDVGFSATIYGKGTLQNGRKWTQRAHLERLIRCHTDPLQVKRMEFLDNGQHNRLTIGSRPGRSKRMHSAPTEQAMLWSLCVAQHGHFVHKGGIFRSSAAISDVPLSLSCPRAFCLLRWSGSLSSIAHSHPHDQRIRMTQSGWRSFVATGCAGRWMTKAEVDI